MFNLITVVPLFEFIADLKTSKNKPGTKTRWTVAIYSMMRNGRKVTRDKMGNLDAGMHFVGNILQSVSISQCTIP